MTRALSVPTTAIRVRAVSRPELLRRLPALAQLLVEVVRGGPTLGFLPSLTHDDAWAYWQSLWPELETESRVLLAAWWEDRLVGSGQLAFPSSPTALHRVELQKLLVSPAVQGRGIGRVLVAALHAAARQRGRSLILLNTRHGGLAERFYRGLGYREAGVIPGFSRGPDGNRYDHITFYQEI